MIIDKMTIEESTVHKLFQNLQNSYKNSNVCYVYFFLFFSYTFHNPKIIENIQVSKTCLKVILLC